MELTEIGNPASPRPNGPPGCAAPVAGGRTGEVETTGVASTGECGTDSPRLNGPTDRAVPGPAPDRSGAVSDPRFPARPGPPTGLATGPVPGRQVGAGGRPRDRGTGRIGSKGRLPGGESP
jgi:hypothetical protein